MSNASPEDLAIDGEEGLFARDVDGHLIRMDKVTAADFDRDVSLSIDGRTITVKKAEEAIESRSDVTTLGHVVHNPQMVAALESRGLKNAHSVDEVESELGMLAVDLGNQL